MPNNIKRVTKALLRSAAAAIVLYGLAMSGNAQEALWSKGRHFQLDGDVVLIAEDGIHDPNNPAVRGVLQQPAEAMKNFPRDDKGIINWVKVIESDLVEPRINLKGEPEEMLVADFDILFTNTGSMPNVRFPHKAHTEWLACANCHPAIFVPQKGANPITMAGIVEGNFCGVCHGKVSFPPTRNCGRCHSVPRKNNLLR